MKKLFALTSGKSLFKVVVLLFILSSAFMTYCAIQIFSIHPKILDLEMFGYSAETVNSIFSAYGNEGMNYYKLLQLGDLIFPIFVFLFSGSLLYKAYGESRSFIYYLPEIYMMSDYVENYFLWSFRESYPQIETETVIISSLFSILKHSTILLIVILYAKSFISKNEKSIT